MEIVGGGQVVELTVADELHHAREEHEMWQESVVLCWWDFGNGIGGYHRIGHQPFHRTGPQAHLTNNFFAPDCVFKRCGIIPLRSQDKFADGFGSGDDTYRFTFTDHAIWTFDQPEVQGELHVTDFHPPVDIYPKQGQMVKEITAGHLEVGGRVRGSLRLNGKNYQVDGLSFRDHGWGIRFWDVFVAHRWVAGTFGPHFTVLAVSVLGTNNKLASFGCVVRDNKLTYSNQIDIVTYLEEDGLTHRGGHLRMTLTTGEIIDIELQVLQKGVVSWMADAIAVTDTMCRMVCGNEVGMCDFEISNNAARGRTRPTVAINAFAEDGLHILKKP